MTRMMKPTSRTPAFLAVFWPLLFAPTVWAACTDVPGPDVYWRRCVFDRQDLEELDLTGATIRDSSFKRADLSDSNLTNADARHAKFVSAIMKRVTLDAANLVKADLTKADLTEASLKGTDLTQARLFQADLSGADLTDARLDGTDLLQTILDGATWIDGVTICAKGSIGRCQRNRDEPKDDGSDVSDTETEPPA